MVLFFLNTGIYSFAEIGDDCGEHIFIHVADFIFCCQTKTTNIFLQTTFLFVFKYRIVFVYYAAYNNSLNNRCTKKVYNKIQCQLQARSNQQEEFGKSLGTIDPDLISIFFRLNMVILARFIVFKVYIYIYIQGVLLRGTEN